MASIHIYPQFSLLSIFPKHLEPPKPLSPEIQPITLHFVHNSIWVFLWIGVGVCAVHWRSCFCSACENITVKREKKNLLQEMNKAIALFFFLFFSSLFSPLIKYQYLPQNCWQRYRSKSNFVWLVKRGLVTVQNRTAETIAAHLFMTSDGHKRRWGMARYTLQKNVWVGGVKECQL